MGVNGQAEGVFWDMKNPYGFSGIGRDEFFNPEFFRIQVGAIAYDPGANGFLCVAAKFLNADDIQGRVFDADDQLTAINVRES